MVKGLEFFGQWFADHQDQYMLIGGTAAASVMDEAGLEFRLTKDLDVVLVVEALTAEFAERFWAFIETGGYQLRQRSETEKPTFYRFQKPTDDRFPVEIELFSRTPDLKWPHNGGQLTPIPFDEAASSLSAILLDADYYTFILDGRRQVSGLPMIGMDRLIPLKALAWLELGERRAAGDQIDERKVRKHINDVFRLSRLLTAATSIPLHGRIVDDMRRFLDAAAVHTVALPALGITGVTQTEVLARIAQAFRLAPQPEPIPNVDGPLASAPAF